MLLWGSPSQAGKEVLIKYVAQSLPADLLSVLKLPLGLCDDRSESDDKEILAGY